MLSNLHKQIATLTLTIGLMSCATPAPNSQSNLTTTNSVQTANAANGHPTVVATTSILCDLTQQVAQATIDLKCMVAPGEDPHLYQPKPEDRKALEQAKLILYAGYDFEPALIKLIKATRNPAPKIAVHEAAVTQPIIGEAHEHEHEHEEHAAGEAPDPHVWHDAKNGIRMVNVIRDRLNKLAPNNASSYNSNAKKITSQLTQIDNWIKSQIATIPPQQRKLVTTHDAMGYYAKAYKIPIEGALTGISTEEAPTAARVGELVKEIRNTKVPTIFAETTINPRLIEAVAREAKVKVSARELYADGLGEKGSEADTYQKMLIANTQTIVLGLGGRYTTP